MSPFERASEIIREGGVFHFLTKAQKRLRMQSLRNIQSKPDGISLMDEDWDNLILLDACRYDTFIKFSPFNEPTERKLTKGTTTLKVYNENFDDREMYNTVLISGNAAIGNIVSDLEFFKFIGLWGDKEYIEKGKQYRDIVTPEEVMSQTREVVAKHSDKRIIAHFLQPHPPFIIRNGERIPMDSPYRSYPGIWKQQIPPEEFRKTYEENVKYILEKIEEFVLDLPGKTVVTADHGELLGESIPFYYKLLHSRWSIHKSHRYEFGHYSILSHPALATVPWVEIESENRRDISAGEGRKEVTMDEEVIEYRLEVLGYK